MATRRCRADWPWLAKIFEKEFFFRDRKGADLFFVGWACELPFELGLSHSVPSFQKICTETIGYSL